MIVAIADDITGAAEIGGIGVRYGLKTMLSATGRASEKADLLVLYSNTRSLPEKEAVAQMERLTRTINGSEPELVYKKTDSVLRGHVVAELQAQLGVLQRRMALLAPVNPGMGRTIVKGRYFIYGQPIDETSFSADPEFPANSSSVEKLLRYESGVHLITPEEKLPGAGIAVAEADSVEHLNFWAGQIDEHMLAAGGGAFFEAILRRHFTKTERKSFHAPAGARLLVSGTSFKPNAEKLKVFGDHLHHMPPAVFDGTDDGRGMSAWTMAIRDSLQKTGKAAMAIDPSARGDGALLRMRMAEAVDTVLRSTPVAELMVEGGSTAYAITERMGWSELRAIEEWAQGIVRLRPLKEDKLHLTIKPGSYQWPPQWQ